MADAQQRGALDVLRVLIICNGAPLADGHELISISVLRAVDRVSSARLEFADRAFPLGDPPALDPGASIEIRAGANDEQLLFAGIVAKHSIRVDGTGDARWIVECRDDKVGREAPDALAGPVPQVSYGVDLISLEAEVERLAPPGVPRVRGRMSFEGSARAHVGAAIELVGVGRRFSGKVIVGSLRHEISQGHWITEVELGPPPAVVLLDSAGNKIEMGPAGIAINSAKDIKLTAQGSIVIASQADVRASGLNVSCEGQVGFVGKGSATAELSATGQTTVRGALVMIN